MIKTEPSPATPIQIGEYRLWLFKGDVWIEHSSEGGAFSIKHFEQAMDKLFEEHF